MKLQGGGFREAAGDTASAGLRGAEDVRDPAEQKRREVPREAGARLPPPAARADKTKDSHDSQTWGMPRHCSASGATPGAGRSPKEGQHTARYSLGQVTLQLGSLLRPPCSRCQSPNATQKLLAPAGPHCWGRALPFLQAWLHLRWLTPWGQGCVEAEGGGIAVLGPAHDQSFMQLPATCH